MAELATIAVVTDESRGELAAIHVSEAGRVADRAEFRGRAALFCDARAERRAARDSCPIRTIGLLAADLRADTADALHSVAAGSLAALQEVRLAPAFLR